MIKLQRVIILLLLSVLVACNQAEETQNKQAEEAVGGVEDTVNKEEELEEETMVESEVEEEVDVEEVSIEESTPTDDQDLGNYEVFLSGEVEETEDNIIIRGESNLLPGSRLIGEVSAGEDDYFTDVTELVEEDGTFYLEFPKHDLQEKTHVVVMFHFDGHQEDEIKRHYGDRGQNLVGPYIYKHKGKTGDGSPQNIYQMAKVEITYEPSEDFIVRQFKEPNWYPIPEDMGDPRVWIEVDEINHDEEFYYLHGRSNLLEGSMLRGSYSGKSYETSVKPDGSFDMIFEYEYKEDTTFKIEFDPSHWSQWNIIEETYGAKGQRLVGELVVQNKWNDNQTIVIEESFQSTEINVPDHVELTVDGPDVTMLLPDHLLFDFDEYVLKEESKDILLEIRDTLQNFDNDIEIEISGHTDSQGDEAYNMDLSNKRAKEVETFLVNEGGLENISFTTVGYGETKPIASNDTESGQAKNRRVEIIINLR